MKHVTKPLSILLSFLMIVSLFAIVPFTAEAATTTARYELVNANPAFDGEGEYLIVSANSTGSQYAMTYDTSVGKTAVTVNAADSTSANPYIKEEDVSAGSVWTAATQAEGYTLKNGDRYLEVSNGAFVFPETPTDSVHWEVSSGNHFRFRGDNQGANRALN